MDIYKTLFKENRLLILIGTALVIASAMANVSTIHFINLAISTHGEILKTHPVLVCSVLIFAFIFGTSSQMLMTQLGYRVVYQMRGKILKQILNTEYEQLQTIGQNRIYATLTKDIRSIQEGFVVFPFFLYASTMAFGGLAYLIVLHPIMAVINILSLLFATLISRFFIKAFQNRIRKERELEDDLFAGFKEILDGHKEVLLNEARGKKLISQLMSGPALHSRDLRTAADRFLVLHIHFLTLVTLFLVLLTFWLVLTMGWGDIALATAFALTLMFIRQPINMMANQIGPLITAQVALRKFKSLNLPEPHRGEPEPVKEWSSLTLDNVVYEYPNDHSGFKLGPINLTVNRGDLLFLVGHNGAGKTTLIRLLIGLTKPSKGQIFLDDERLTDDLRRGYRAQFSAVLSDFHLFDHVDEESNTTNEIIRDWLTKLDLHQKINFEGAEFSSTDLSIGQRKRLAMVTAVSESRKLMVLDEWTADQDPRFRLKFYKQLLPELKAMGYTCLVVSHDDRYFDVADRLLELEDGQIVEKSAQHVTPLSLTE